MNRTDDWYDVEPITEEGYRILEGPYYGQFLVSGTERALAIDASTGVGDLRGLVTGLVDVPVTLLLTHWHWDHIGSAAGFDDVRIHENGIAPDGRVRIDGLTDEFVERPGQFVEDWLSAGNAFPDGFDPDTYTIEPVENPTPMEPGERFDLGDRELESYYTPGHSRDHLAMLDREQGVLYGGDVIHLDAGLYAHFQGGDLGAYRDTFERLVELRDDGAFDTLVTSHNPPFSGEELELLDRLREGVGQILDGEVDPETVETEWGPAHRYEFEGSPVLTKPSVP